MRVVETAGTGFAFRSQTAYITRDSGLDSGAKLRTERQMRRRGRRTASDADETGTQEEEGSDEDEGIVQTP